ncbi:protein SUPPRESSOR OF npr1-1, CONSTITUTIVE 1-like [Syzygium oleosum]|uniref:protein SUPPRESSOR OF npr1-1, CONSTITUTIVE 1-like n=1 Tax=Syzygium oleosum TaxID=219896 RepID=UPI0024BB111C|nr:protein SUPPRESSOR OF npr1-1, CONSTITUTIVE 1-like [Syzygium oleosum]
MATELKVLNLRNCRSLRRIPDLSTFESLEILILAYCSNLEEIHPSIGDIKTLVSLDASYCTILKALPAGIEIEELPESIGSMKELKTLNAKGCRLLARIPSSIGELASLQSLSLRRCSSLTEIPDSIGKLASLTELNLGYTSITKLPKSIGNMPNLRILKIIGTHVTELPDAIGKLAKLQRLGARECRKLERLPSNICELVSLEELSLDFSGISNMPESISKLSSLKKLSVACCEKLREIPELPSGLKDLAITCQRPPLPNLSQLSRLKILTLCNCPWLERVPELPVGLLQLNITDCGKLKAFTNVSNLKHLPYLELHNCFDLAEVTGLEGSHCLSNLPAGQCPKISQVDGIEDSSTLMSPKASQLDGSLDLSDSKILQRMDAGASCANSVEIQDLDGSKSSQVSDILKCTSAGQLQDFSSFKYLSSLSVYGCNSVTEIQGPDGSESLTYLMLVLFASFQLAGILFIEIPAVIAMVQQAMQYVDQTTNLETKIELMKTLNSVGVGSFVLRSPGLCLFTYPFQEDQVPECLMQILPKRRKGLKKEAETHLSLMVVSKSLMAKIDRPMGIVSFQMTKDSNEILNSGATNLGKLLDLVEKSCHQIPKETVVHKDALRARRCLVE